MGDGRHRPPSLPSLSLLAIRHSLLAEQRSSLPLSSLPHSSFPYQLLSLARSLVGLETWPTYALPPERERERKREKEKLVIIFIGLYKRGWVTRRQQIRNVDQDVQSSVLLMGPSLEYATQCLILRAVLQYITKRCHLAKWWHFIWRQFPYMFTHPTPLLDWTSTSWRTRLFGRRRQRCNHQRWRRLHWSSEAVS